MFFIFWGRKVVRKKIGRVADYCSVCRDFRPFRGSKLESVGHVYAIPLGSCKTLGYTRTCESCSCTFPMQPEVYSSLSKDRQAPLAVLTRETHPQILEHCCQQIQLDWQARHGKLSAEERRAYILEPFILLNDRLEGWVSRPSFDGCVVVSFLMTVALFCVSMSRFSHRGHASGEPSSEVLIGLVFASFLAYLIASGSRLGRFMRTQILPIAAESLRSCSPTAVELEAAVEHLKRMRTRIGKALQVKDVHRAFEIGESTTFAPGVWS
jgi:hypothetical protein